MQQIWFISITSTKRKSWKREKQSTCILMFKSSLTEMRINILKHSTDGFEIFEEDMKLRGFGDILGFKQSGMKIFKLADPIHNNDLLTS